MTKNIVFIFEFIFYEKYFCIKVSPKENSLKLENKRLK